MKVGFATNDNILINDHFGWAKNFAIYEINMDGFRFLENRYFEEENEEFNRIDRKIEKLRDVKIIFIESIGGTAAARVVKSGIYPIVKKGVGTSQGYLKIEDVMEELRDVLLKNPPPWLKKIMLKENGKSA